MIESDLPARIVRCCEDIDYYDRTCEADPPARSLSCAVGTTQCSSDSIDIDRAVPGRKEQFERFQWELWKKGCRIAIRRGGRIVVHVLIVLIIFLLMTVVVGLLRLLVA